MGLTVVELDVVPVDQTADLRVDLEVATSAPLRGREPSKRLGTLVLSSD